MVNIFRYSIYGMKSLKLSNIMLDTLDKALLLELDPDTQDLIDNVRRDNKYDPVKLFHNMMINEIFSCEPSSEKFRSIGVIEKRLYNTPHEHSSGKINISDFHVAKNTGNLQIFSKTLSIHK